MSDDLDRLPREAIIAHLTLHGWVPRTQAALCDGLRNGLTEPNRKYFFYEWGGGLQIERVDEQRVGWDHDQWYMFSTADLWLFVEKCNALS